MKLVGKWIKRQEESETKETKSERLGEGSEIIKKNMMKLLMLMKC